MKPIARGFEPSRRRKRRRHIRKPADKEAFRQEMVCRYEALEGVTDLARKTGYSKEGIYVILRQYGVVRKAGETWELRRASKPQKEHRYACHELLTAEEWRLAYWNDEAPSLEIIGERFGMKSWEVDRALRHHNISRRSRIEAVKQAHEAGRMKEGMRRYWAKRKQDS